MEAFAAGVEDGGEVPVLAVAEPADDGEGGVEVLLQFLGGGGFDAVEAIEVEDGVGGGEDVGGGTGVGAGLPDGGGGHGADGLVCSLPIG